jgi:hypothetical protein
MSIRDQTRGRQKPKPVTRALLSIIASGIKSH